MEKNEGFPGKVPSLFSLSRFIRIIIYIILLLLLVAGIIDKSLITLSKEKIKEQYELGNDEINYYDNLLTIGFYIGCALYLLLLRWNIKKTLIILSLLLNGGTFLFLLFSTKEKIMFYSMRVLRGIINSFSFIYFPVWVDKFGLFTGKTLMLSIYSLITIYDPIIHTSLCSIIQKIDLTIIIYCIEGFLIFSLITIIITPHKYFSDYLNYENQENKERQSLFNISKEQNKKTKFVGLLKNGTYIFSTLTQTNMLFVLFAIIQYIENYAMNIFYIFEYTQFMNYYEFVKLIGPTIGTLFIGILSLKTGNYEDKSSIFICLVYVLLLLLDSFTLVICKSIIMLNVSLFFYYFLVSGLFPIFIGYSISSIPIIHKYSGYSLNVLITYFLGRYLLPESYSYIHKIMKSKSHLFAWKYIIFSMFFGFGTLLLGCLFRYKDLLKKFDKINNKQHTNNCNQIESMSDRSDIELIDVSD